MAIDLVVVCIKLNNTLLDWRKCKAWSVAKDEDMNKFAAALDEGQNKKNEK